jgi:hypothetical protein
MRRVALLCLLVQSLLARAQDGPCADPPANQYGRWQGPRTCWFDAARKQRYSLTHYEDGKEVGPLSVWRADGSLASVHHFTPNVSGYASLEAYYETGGIRTVQFEKPGSTIILHYTVSGRIHHLSCLPGRAGGYAYSLADCQPVVPFELRAWRPSR